MRIEALQWFEIQIYNDYNQPRYEHHVLSIKTTYVLITLMKICVEMVQIMLIRKTALRVVAPILHH